MTTSRPNILMIMADQLPASCVGAYGHRIIKTPHIDRLAERGVAFRSAYCNSPICAPSRASMCTGRYVSDIGAYDNGTDFPASTPTFMHHLGRAGYATLLSGKMHFLGPDQSHGFQRRLTPEIYPSSFVWTPDWRQGAYHNPGTAVNQLRQAGLCDWNLQLDYDEQVHFRALEALRDLARRQDEDRPFFLCASYTHPHDPFVTMPRWWDLYEHDEIDMPSVAAGPIEEMHAYNQWLQVHHMIDVYPPREEDVRNARHAFYGMVSYFDECVGQLVAELDRLGMAQNTIVVVTSDHGEMLGEHGMWFKRTFYDNSVRVPLVFAGTDRIAGGRYVDQTVSLVDLLPTFNDLAGTTNRDELEAGLPGDSLCGLLEGSDFNGERHAIIEYLSEGVCEPMRTIARDNLKYVHVRSEPDQLFDLKNDPGECENVVDDPAYAGRLSHLRETLLTDWDDDEIRACVLESQGRRRIVNEAMAQGPRTAWDVEPQFDARTQFVREQDAQATNAAMRFPYRPSESD